MMDARYERNLPALSEAECLALGQKRVLVVGCGGLGGHIIDQLARIGVGAIRAVDGDVFESSNLNRQLLSAVPLLGVSKAKAAAEHIARVNPEITVAWAPPGNHVGPTRKSRGPHGEITWAPPGNHVGPKPKSRGPHGEITCIL